MWLWEAVIWLSLLYQPNIKHPYDVTEKPKQAFWPTQYHLRLNDGKIGLLVKKAGYEEVRGGDVQYIRALLLGREKSLRQWVVSWEQISFRHRDISTNFPYKHKFSQKRVTSTHFSEFFIYLLFLRIYQFKITLHNKGLFGGCYSDFQVQQSKKLRACPR